MLAALQASWAAALPRRTLEHYALIGIEGVRVRSLVVDEGDLGVNSGRLVIRRGLTAPRFLSITSLLILTVF